MVHAVESPHPRVWQIKRRRIYETEILLAIATLHVCSRRPSSLKSVTTFPLAPLWSTTDSSLCALCRKQKQPEWVLDFRERLEKLFHSTFLILLLWSAGMISICLPRAEGNEAIRRLDKTSIFSGLLSSPFPCSRFMTYLWKRPRLSPRGIAWRVSWSCDQAILHCCLCPSDLCGPNFKRILTVTCHIDIIVCMFGSLSHLPAPPGLVLEARRPRWPWRSYIKIAVSFTISFTSFVHVTHERQYPDFPCVFTPKLNYSGHSNCSPKFQCTALTSVYSLSA